MLNEVFEILDKFGSESVEMMRESHIQAGQVASGRTLESFQHMANIDPDKVILNVKAAEHSEWVDRGRCPGGFPPIDNILQWIEDKGLGAEFDREYKKRAFAFLIGRKIAAEGTYLHRTGSTQQGVEKPISSVFSEQRIEELQKQINKILNVELKSDFIKQFKQHGYDIRNS